MANEIKVGFKINGDSAALDKINGQVNSLNNSSQRLAGANSQALDRILSKVKQVENTTNSSAEKIKKSFEGGSSSAGAFNTKLGDITAGTAALGLGFKQGFDIVVGFFKSSIDEAAKFERSIIGVTSVAQNLGEDTGKLKNVILDLTKDGLIPASDAAAGLKNLMASGLSLNQSIALFNSLKDSAAFNRQGFLSMGEAIVGATQGIKNQQSIMVDNAGITKNLSIMWKEYAATIGKTAEKLTDAEKAQAAFVGITKEAAIFQGDAEKLTKTYSGSIDGLDAAFVKLKISMGTFFTQSGLIQRNITTLANTFDQLSKPVDNTREGKIASLKQQLDAFVASGSSAYTTIRDLRDQIAKLEKEDAEAKASRSKLIGNDVTDELMANQQNRARIAIITKKQIDEQARIENEARLAAAKKQAELYKELLKKYQDYNNDKVKELRNAEARELKIAGSNEELKYKIKQSFAEKIFETEKKNNERMFSLRAAQAEYEKKLDAEREKREKERIRQIENNKKVTGDFFSNPFSDTVRQRNQTQADYDRSKLIGQAGGVANSVLQGKEGARSLISGAGAAAADMFFPGAGQVVGPLLTALSQGPEQTRAMVKEFAAAIPDLIQAIIESLPVIVEELANQAPVIIDRLVEKTPQIVEGLVKAMPKVATALVMMAPRIAAGFIKEIPSMAVQFVTALVGEAPRFVWEMVKALSNMLSGGLLGGKGDFLGNLTDKANPFGGSWDAKRMAMAAATGGASELPVVGDVISGVLGGLFANGGIMSSRGAIPLNKYSNGGIANSPQIAVFGEGRMNEAYIPLPDGHSVPVTLKGGESGAGEMSMYLLNKIVQLLQIPMNVTTSLSINNRSFGEIILEMNRSNQRLA